MGELVRALYINRHGTPVPTKRADAGCKMKKWLKGSKHAAHVRYPGYQGSSHVESLRVTRLLSHTQSSKISYISINTNYKPLQ